MSFTIRGVGTALPRHGMSQREATELAHRVVCEDDQQRRLLSVLYRKSGVAQRYTAVPHQLALQWAPDEAHDGDTATAMAVGLGPTTAERMELYAEHATPLALVAAQAAMADARVAPRELTHLVTVSCTGFEAPGVDIGLITSLGLKPTIERVHVGFMGCHGAINGLRVARALTAADPAANVLLCAVELCSLHYRFAWDPERIVANAIFADGAGAVVGDGAEPADALEWTVAATGSCLIPDSTDAMSWRLGDHGFEMTLQPSVPELIREHLRPWLSEWLGAHGYTIASIPTWAIHPGGPRILDAVEASLNLPREATGVSRDILANQGNMSSPTVLFILERLRRTGAPRPCVALGFGPGLMAEAALLV